MKDCWAYQPEARPSMSSLACSLLSMYNAALPGEYLEMMRPALPTPPSSTENSSHQFIPTPPQFIPSEYRTADQTSDKKDASAIRLTLPTNHRPRSPPNNHRPADNTHSDLTTHAGYHNRQGTNVGGGHEWNTIHV